MKIRKSQERGHADHGWLNAYHSFSFADYYDPKHMGFGLLRVINEDRIDGGAGFPTHGHRDMEIITYIIDGSLEHKDSIGNTASIVPGEVQRMSAGTGVRHSEFNHYPDKKTHLLQIWILPDKNGYPPSYEQKSFSKVLSENGFVLVASNHGKDGSVSLNQDVNMYVGKVSHAKEIKFSCQPHRQGWIQMVKGSLKVNDMQLGAGDGLSYENITELELKLGQDTEFILFDMVKFPV